MIVAIWRGCFNFISSSLAGDELVIAVIGRIVMILVVAILAAIKLQKLSHMERVIK